MALGLAVLRAAALVGPVLHLSILGVTSCAVSQGERASDL